MGQLKVPFSLEALYSARWTRFSERAMGPLNLAPFRDVGLNVFGRAFNGRLEYAAGLFNGSFAKGAANAGTEKAVRLSWQAARLLGLQDRLGSIDKGKDADLLILDGPPLDYRTYVETAIVSGKVRYDRVKDHVYPVFDRATLK